MKRIAILALAISLMPFAAQAETVWNGGASWRYVIRKNDDGLSAKDTAGKDSSISMVKAHQLRMDLNATNKGDVWDWGVGFRTFGSANSEWLSLQNNLDLAVTLENAYLRAKYGFWESDLHVTLGRSKSVMLYDSIGQILFDKDNRWDGLGWSWKKSSFGLNLSQYVLGATNKGVVGASTLSRTASNEDTANTRSGFGMLFSFQPHIKFKVAEEIEAILAVGYHVWSGTGGTSTGGWYTNAIHGGTAAPTTAANLTGDNQNPIIMDNARQFQIMTDWTLPANFRFVGEYIQNKKVNYGTRATPTAIKAQTGALALSLVYGKVKKAKDWALSYSYVRKGLASSINTFSNSNMPADNIGHLVDAKYALADGLTLGGKMELYREKAKLGGDGVALTGTGVNRKQSQNRYEFVAGMTF